MKILSQNKKKILVINGDAELLIVKNNSVIKYKKAPNDSYLLLAKSLNGSSKEISVLGYFDDEKIAIFILKKLILEKKALVEVPEHNFKVDEFIANVKKKKIEKSEADIEVVKPEVIDKMY